MILVQLTELEEWNNDGPNVKNFAVSGKDNIWQIDEFDNEGIYTSSQRLNLNQTIRKRTRITQRFKF